MKNTNLKLTTSDEAEALFYEAFRHCDKDVMAALWAEGDVVCVHPSSGAIVGHDAVVRSWVHIFTNATMPDIKITLAKKIVSGDLAVHLVTEEISTDGEFAVVLCTNIYQKYDNNWYMIEHHASVVPSRMQGHTLQ